MYLFLMHVYHNSSAEVLKILRGRPGDLMGLVILTVQVCLMCNAFSFPITMITNLDPMFSITEQIFYGWDPRFKFTFRFILNLWATVQVTRPLLVCVTCSLSFIEANKAVITEITKQKLSWHCLQLYSRLQLTANIGHDAIKQLAAVYMALGFYLSVVVNFVIINCFNSIPLLFYLCSCTIAVMVYLCLNFLLPEVVYCSETSEHLLSSLWRWEFVGIKRTSLRKQSSILGKTLRAQRPIKYQYGNAVFDKETKTNYYWNILESTIDILLLN